MTQRTSTAIACVFAALIGIWILLWFLSPRLYASSVMTAAASGDKATLVNRMDIERIRKSAADDLTEVTLATSKLGGGKALSNVLRMAITKGVEALHANDDPALAEKIANLINGRGFVSSAVYKLIPKENLARRTGEAAGDYGDTHDLFFERVRFRETGEELSLMFERRGVFAWRLVAIKTNGGSVLAPPLTVN